MATPVRVLWQHATKDGSDFASDFNSDFNKDFKECEQFTASLLHQPEPMHVASLTIHAVLGKALLTGCMLERDWQTQSPITIQPVAIDSYYPANAFLPPDLTEQKIIYEYAVKQCRTWSTNLMRFSEVDTEEWFARCVQTAGWAKPPNESTNNGQKE